MNQTQKYNRPSDSAIINIVFKVVFIPVLHLHWRKTRAVRRKKGRIFKALIKDVGVALLQRESRSWNIYILLLVILWETENRPVPQFMENRGDQISIAQISYCDGGSLQPDVEENSWKTGSLKYSTYMQIYVYSMVPSLRYLWETPCT